MKLVIKSNKNNKVNSNILDSDTLLISTAKNGYLIERKGNEFKLTDIHRNNIFFIGLMDIVVSKINHLIQVDNLIFPLEKTSLIYNIEV